jgi:hypothetical protein
MSCLMGWESFRSREKNTQGRHIISLHYLAKPSREEPMRKARKNANNKERRGKAREALLVFSICTKETRSLARWVNFLADKLSNLGRPTQIFSKTPHVIS